MEWLFLFYIIFQDHPTDRPDATKKRRSDVLASGEGAPKAAPKTERHKNGTDAEARPAKRAKVDHFLFCIVISG